MLTRDDATTRVARGAAHLDTVRPGWFNRIDTGTLSLASCSQCVLGQLFDGDFWDGAEAFWGTTLAKARTLTSPEVEHGFALCRDDYSGVDVCDPDVAQSVYAPLQDAWIEEIATRQLAAEAAQSIEQPASERCGTTAMEQPVMATRASA